MSAAADKSRAQAGRIAITEVSPVAEAGRWPAKAVPLEAVPVRAAVFREGHGAVGAQAVLIAPDGRTHSSQPMREVNPGLARWEGAVVPDAEGDWRFRVEAWGDPWATWLRDALVKVPVGQDVELVLEAGALLADRAHARQGVPKAARDAFRETAARLRDQAAPPAARLEAATSNQAAALFERFPLKEFTTRSQTWPLRVQRERALVGSWYEVFPRSVGARFSPETGWVSGTLRTCADGLDRIAAMGFDVLYLTPVHPIGVTFRKGRNNALTARPGDPGSPYAIGSPAGGHDAIHPELGTFDDFDALVAKARGLGMEVALDLALQCSPDHPWVSEHPEWFTRRPDGSIAYAENPPKRYQDIYPLDFDNDPEGIYQEILRIVRMWIAHGVTIFRVDNPHTKPLPFWERLLAQVAAESPQVVFLAEAFTRPPMMRQLALVGFHQSYTYFAWRNTKDEVLEYLGQLASDEGSFLRPAIWPTTPDILTPYMQTGGEAAFKIRAILAATFAPTWGVYSGYELVENQARPGSEEQLDNEKYEFKVRDFTTPTALAMSGLLAALNSARRDHPALRRLRNVHVHQTTDPATVAYSRHVGPALTSDDAGDSIMVVVNLDPHQVRESGVEVDLAALGLPPGTNEFQVFDLLSGQTHTWGRHAYVRLDPAAIPGHVFHVRSL